VVMSDLFFVLFYLPGSVCAVLPTPVVIVIPTKGWRKQTWHQAYRLPPFPIVWFTACCSL
ncbi:hypothetical protein QOZ28_31860, partial [Pseudomonas aeruginosa]|uniref:hypothetical protein n=1 Tax=Pseudomonas aeruginosa TaxID=287 RepID=UPI00345771E4